MLALAAFAFSVASSEAGNLRLIEASLRQFEADLLHPREIVFGRPAPCSQASASSWLFKSGNFFDIASDLLVVHEAHADRPDSVSAPGEDAKDRAPGAGPKTQHASFAGDDRVADDGDVAGEQGLDLLRATRHAQGISAGCRCPSRSPRTSCGDALILYMQKQLGRPLAAAALRLRGRPRID